MIYYKLHFLLLLLLIPLNILAQNNSMLFPMEFGGTKGKIKGEDIRTIIYDPLSDCLYFGGVTNSEDFGPAFSNHGFIIALCNGYTRWGVFNYNKMIPFL
jgi:hypothetical protein